MIDIIKEGLRLITTPITEQVQEPVIYEDWDWCAIDALRMYSLSYPRIIDFRHNSEDKDCPVLKGLNISQRKKIAAKIIDLRRIQGNGATRAQMRNSLIRWNKKNPLAPDDWL